jgi:E3 ubiquitin-protein ligase RGLG
LHDVSDPSLQNPYQQSLSIVAQDLWDFDEDHMIPAYGFGDKSTLDKGVFSFHDKGVPCKGLTGCVSRYRELAAAAELYGPTSFAPLIRQAVRLVRETKEYHILVIIADGQVSETGNCLQATIDAIVEASNYALSIVMVGVGDGPWHTMDRFDDDLPKRRFDNFQFVNFNSVFARYPSERREAAFATHALMEIPEQYQTMKRLGYLNPSRRLPQFSSLQDPLGPPAQ